VIALAVLVLVVVAAAMTVAVAVRAARPLVSRERIEALASSGSFAAPAALRTLDESDRTSPLVQVVVGAGAVAVGWLCVAAARSAATGTGRVVAVVVALLVALLVLVLAAELVPRAAALAAPERVMVTLAWPYRAVVGVLGPLATLSSWVASALLLPVGMWLDGGRRRAHSTDELAELVASLDDGGPFDVVGQRLLSGALGFLDVRVRDVMARRDRIVTVPRTSTVAEAEELVHRSGHSRVLVVGADGEVTGFLHAKDLIALPAERRHGYLPAGLVRVALRVGPDDRLEDVLPRMRRARRHVAVVESGGEVLGLVTLEDVLEAIVGDIRDESDLDDEPDEPDEPVELDGADRPTGDPDPGGAAPDDGVTP